MDWYVSRDGDREGPFSSEQIRLLAETGDLKSRDLVWRTGMEQWTPAQEVPGLLTPPPLKHPHVHVVVSESKPSSVHGQTQRAESPTTPARANSLEAPFLLPIDASAPLLQVGEGDLHAIKDAHKRPHMTEHPKTRLMNIIGAVAWGIVGVMLFLNKIGDQPAGVLTAIVFAYMLLVAVPAATAWALSESRTEKLRVAMLWANWAFIGLWCLGTVGAIYISTTLNAAQLWSAVGGALVFVLPQWINIRALRALPLHRKQNQSSVAPMSPQLVTAPNMEVGLSAKRNYFVRHWYGELTLGVSYWVNGFLGNIALYAVILGLAGILRGSTNNYVHVVYWCGIYLVAFAIVIWQLTGIWRSANQHIARTYRSGWANAAKAAVVIGLLRFFGDFLGTGVPAIQEALRQGDWLTKNAKWEINLLRDGTEVELRGGLGHGISDDFQKILNAAPNIQLVHVNLELGGLVDEGNKLFTMIQNRKLATYTSSQCVSACSIAFLGGSERYIKKGARLGFHAYKIPGVSESDTDYKAEKTLLVSSGVSPEFAERVFATKHDTMWYPEPSELLQHRVVNAVVSGDEFSYSGFKRQSLTANLESELLKIRLMKSIKLKEPELFQKIHQEYAQGIQAGQSLNELRPILAQHIRSIRDKYLPYASAPSAVAYAAHVASITKALRGTPRVCFGYLANGDPASSNAAAKLYPPGLADRELDVLADLVDTADGTRPLPTAIEKDRALTATLVLASEILGTNAWALPELSNPKLDPGMWCESFLAIYSATALIPETQARAAIVALAGK